ncbi:hypothetical protein OCB09_00070 [Bacillus cereus]|nr:hypothetical protein [Bacillus cereus]
MKRKRIDNKTILIQRLKDIAIDKGGVLLSTEWKTSKAKYDFKCKDGHSFKLSGDKVFSRGDWCPFCAGRYGKFQEKYRHIIEEMNNGTMLSNYVNGKTHISCQCENGHIFFTLPSNLLQGKWCGECRMSHGERAIEYYLKKNKIPFMKQFTFDDLKGDVRHLSFDFAVLDDNDNLIYLIEYDGEQHFRPLRHSRNKEANLEKFHRTVRNDELKNAYCLRNCIPLIRISFFDVDERRLDNLYRDVENILNEKLFVLV